MRKRVVCGCGYTSNAHTSIVKLSFIRNAHSDCCDDDPEIKGFKTIQQ